MKRNKKINIVGIIHARGGSVRLPLKNIRPLAGRPLISYMIKAAKRSRYLNRVIVSTDHPEIRKIALRNGAEAPFVRPKKISGNCASFLVTQHAVRSIEKDEKGKVDIAVTLQPTNPFCRAKDIDSCVEMALKDKKAQSVFSAVEVKKRPEWMFRLKEKKGAKLYMPGSIKGKRAIRQSLKKLITPNGGIYVTKRKALSRENTLISKNTLAYMMPEKRSVDIDCAFDLKIAGFLLKNGKGIA